VSGAIKISKAAYRGDPGIFSFVGKALGAVAGVVSKVVPGPIGAIAGLANKVLTPASNGKPLNPSVTSAARALPPTAINVLQSSNIPTLYSPPPLPQQPDSVRTSGVSLFPGGPMVGTQTQYYPGNNTQSQNGGARPGAPCGSGFHTNKTGYYTRQGYVAPGTKCVRNRKRNPLNPRAASRAMSRLSSAKKAAKFLGSISIREKGCGCK
jgi:hypothetical protein